MAARLTSVKANSKINVASRSCGLTARRCTAPQPPRLSWSCDFRLRYRALAVALRRLRLLWMCICEDRRKGGEEATEQTDVRCSTEVKSESSACLGCTASMLTTSVTGCWTSCSVSRGIRIRTFSMCLSAFPLWSRFSYPVLEPPTMAITDRFDLNLGRSRSQSAVSSCVVRCKIEWVCAIRQ